MYSTLRFTLFHMGHFTGALIWLFRFPASKRLKDMRGTVIFVHLFQTFDNFTFH